MGFPMRLNELMKHRNITAYRVAKDTGIPERLVGYWRHGEKSPTLENILRLVEYFDVSADYLLGRTDYPNSNTIKNKMEHFVMERKIDDTPGFEMFINVNGVIAIKQESIIGDDNVVVIHPMHVDKAIQWLQELRDELLDE